jgi:predicted nucleic acid-binding protein
VIYYLDTSVVLRVLLGQPGTLPEWGRWQEASASELLGVESRRAIDRLRLESNLDDVAVGALQESLKQVERAIGRIRLTRAVLKRASMPMATAVKTLDAIHLASALMLQERRRALVTFATHDGSQATAARALGFACAGV